VEFQVISRGKTAHGSAPWRGVNAVYKMIPVITKIQELNETISDPTSKHRGSIALINISCKPGKLSVIPDVCTIHVDRRLGPQEEPEFAMRQLQNILTDHTKGDLQFNGEVRVRREKRKSYTGFEDEISKMMKGWGISEKHSFVKESQAIIEQVLGRESTTITWDFATDGSWSAGMKAIPTIGFSPCEEEYAHTPNERVNIDYMIDAAKVYSVMIANSCGIHE
jgi:putative selenium metabolism hydrolase